MSVVLTACRHSKQRAIERALKRKAEKQKKRQQKRTQAYLELAERQKRLAEQQFVEEFTEMDLSQLALTRMWSFQMMGTVYTVVLLLESGKEIVEIFCNDDPVSYITDIADGTITFDFLICGSYKARISCRRHSEGMQHCLTVDGYAVPEVE